MGNILWVSITRVENQYIGYNLVNIEMIKLSVDQIMDCLLFALFVLMGSSSSLIQLICLFDLILNVPSTISQLNRDGSSWVEPVLS